MSEPHVIRTLPLHLYSLIQCGCRSTNNPVASQKRPRHRYGQIVLTQMNPVGAGRKRDIGTVVHNKKNTGRPAYLADRARDLYKLARAPFFVPQLDCIGTPLDGEACQFDVGKT
jgi:hypothetical protein